MSNIVPKILAREEKSHHHKLIITNFMNNMKKYNFFGVIRYDAKRIRKHQSSVCVPRSRAHGCNDPEQLSDDTFCSQVTPGSILTRL